jgi:TPR repeat protein
LQVSHGEGTDQDPEALCRSAEDHFKSGRPVKAAELYSLAAEQGHAVAREITEGREQLHRRLDDRRRAARMAANMRPTLPPDQDDHWQELMRVAMRQF